jgi:hypothetical protein
MKLKLLWRLLFAKKYLLVTGDKTVNITTTYPDEELTRSGNAIYIHPVKKES